MRGTRGALTLTPAVPRLLTDRVRTRVSLRAPRRRVPAIPLAGRGKASARTRPLTRPLPRGGGFKGRVPSRAPGLGAAALALRDPAELERAAFAFFAGFLLRFLAGFLDSVLERMRCDAERLARPLAGRALRLPARLRDLVPVAFIPVGAAAAAERIHAPEHRSEA